MKKQLVTFFIYVAAAVISPYGSRVVVVEVEERAELMVDDAAFAKVEQRLLCTLPLYDKKKKWRLLKGC